MKTVFLGGTCNDSTWRDVLITLLNENVSFFNPVFPDWTEECMAREIHARENSDFVLYTITPRMTGVYSIAEVIDDSNKRPDKTLFAVLFEDDDLYFTPAQLKSLGQVSQMVQNNGGAVFTCLHEVADFLNKA